MRPVKLLVFLHNAVTCITRDEQLHAFRSTVSGLSGSVRNLGAIGLTNLYKSKTNAPSTKDTMDDAACIVFHNGLPTIIATDGAYGCESKLVHEITATVIPNVIAPFISKLSAAKTDDERKTILETIFREINTAVSQRYDVATAGFVFSAAITFQDCNGKTRVVGFGNGDVTVAIKDTAGVVSVLKPAQRVLNCKDDYVSKYLTSDEIVHMAPEAPPHQKQFLPAEIRGAHTIDNMVVHIPHFDRLVSEGDTVFCFSDGVLDLLPPYRVTKKNISQDEVLVDVVPAQLAVLQNVNPSAIVSACTAERDKQFQTLPQNVRGVGDDLIIASVTIPSQAQRDEIMRHSQAQTQSENKDFNQFMIEFQNTTERKKSWAHYPGGNNDYAQDTSPATESVREQEWQYRFSILPTAENLENAACALQNVALLRADNFPSAVKLRTISGDRALGELQYWDTAEPCPAGYAPSDRQQAGKELCVYVENFDADYHKELILQIWRAFEDAGVELSYRPVPRDEKLLDAESGVLCPVMYSAGKYDRTQPDNHGILLSENYNPKKFADPFEKLRITKSDLKKHGIQGCGFLKNAEKQIQYQDAKNKTHQVQLKTEWQSVNTQAEGSEKNKELAISAVIADFFDGKRADIHDFANRFPLTTAGVPQPFATLQQLTAIRNQNDSGSRKTLTDDLDKVEKKLVQDIHSSNFCSFTGATQEEVARAVIYQPQKMMELYRRCVHITHDIQATNDCKERIINAAPKSYRAIWDDEKGKDDFEKAKLLLQDYTKNDSRISRFFHGHINRHYCKEVNATLKTAVDLPALMNTLSQIIISNPIGSLATRIAFIRAKTGVYCHHNVNIADMQSKHTL